MKQLALRTNGILDEFTISGASAGPLAGTTFVAKDLYQVEGHVASAGSPDWRRTHEPATVTAQAIMLLLDAGAKLVGKATTDEMAFSLDGINVHFGVPMNGQYEDRIPGGSSSGSASAVSTGLADFALGTDTGGSVRVPASYCGIYGIRPSHGRVPIEGVIPLAPSCDTVGWFARSPAILKKVGQILLNEQSTSEEISEILVARDLFEVVSDSVKPALERAIKTLMEIGYGLSETSLNAMGWHHYLSTFRIIQGREAWKCHGTWIEAVKPNFAPFIKERFDFAASVTQEQYDQALSLQKKITAEFEKLLGAGRLLCMPITRDLPPLVNSSAEELAYNRTETLNLTATGSLTGMPQVTIPVELAGGKKIGLSFLAPKGKDMLLLDFCERLANQL
jgi:amidase